MEKKVKRQKKSGLTAEQRDAVIRALTRCLECDDLRVVIRAAAKLIAIEGQNQEDELGADPQ